MLHLNFLSLPVEIICYVLDYLEMSDLLRCTTLTKQLRGIIRESSRLQYAIELAKHRMVSLLPYSEAPPIVSRLKLIRDREHAWRSMTWKGRHKLKLPPTGSVYEFVGGLYGNGREDERRVTASISFMELPSTESPPSGDDATNLKTWTHYMGDITIIDFTMDPSQDLLILVALAPPDSKYLYDLYLRTLSTNEIHPKAPLPILPCLPKLSINLQPSDTIAAVRVQVAGDLVALLVKEIPDGVGAHLEIWNWEHGPHYSCSMTRDEGIDDFTFLSHSTFLLVRPKGRFEVYAFENPITSSSAPICRTSYGFPPLSNGYVYWYISMSSNPAPGYVPGPTGIGQTEKAGKHIYHPSPNDRIHACCLYIFNPSGDGDHRVHSFVFFLNINIFLDPHPEWLMRAPPNIPLPARAASSSVDSSVSDADSHSSASPATSSSSVMDNFEDTAPSTPVSIQSASGFQPHPTTAPGYPPFPTFTPYPYPLPTPPIPTAALSHTYAPAPRGSMPLLYSPSANPVHIPWEVWGPQTTRWFQECVSTDWQHAIYGLRTVESVRRKARPNEEWVAGSGIQDAGQSDSPLDYNMEFLTSHELPSDEDELGEGEGENQDSVDRPCPRRHLRLRDFNPYSIRLAAESQDSKGKRKVGWGTPHVVTGPSTTHVRGVFEHDIVSSLPYTEVVSEETFEVTDVMMDDCRLLLLKRAGQAAKLKGVDVLMI